MKRVILLFMLVIGLMIPTVALSDSNVTVNWTPGSESDLAGHYVYVVTINKEDTTGNHVLKKDGGTPTETVVMPTSSVVISSQPDGFYAVVVSSFDTADNESGKSNEAIERIDTTPPVITMVGSTPMEIERGSTFTDPGATATDNLDGDITSMVIVSGSVNVNIVGTYTLTYGVSDESFLTASVMRTINVVDNAPPEPPTNVIITWEMIIAWIKCTIFGRC
jgi:hypothetical protein